MLVLSRKADESIFIDGNIEIKVLDVRGNRVRLGISAPGDVSIRRAELVSRFGYGRSEYEESEERQELCVAR